MDNINLTDHFLIAMPATEDPCFAKSLIYIAEHNDQGALGIIVNRPIDMNLATIFEQIDLPLESINVDELEGGTIWYSNVLEMTPELQNIKIETSQETKKNTNTKVKTGDHTKYMVYMRLIGLSLLGVYCIIMRKCIH